MFMVHVVLQSFFVLTASRQDFITSMTDNWHHKYFSSHSMKTIACHHRRISALSCQFSMLYEEANFFDNI